MGWFSFMQILLLFKMSALIEQGFAAAFLFIMYCDISHDIIVAQQDGQSNPYMTDAAAARRERQHVQKGKLCRYAGDEEA